MDMRRQSKFNRGNRKPRSLPRIATATPPNRPTTQRRLLQRAAGTKGGTDGYSNVCRTRRQNPSVRASYGGTTRQREIESLWPVGDQRRTIQLVCRPVDHKFDRRTSQVG